MASDDIETYYLWLSKDQTGREGVVLLPNPTEEPVARLLLGAAVPALFRDRELAERMEPHVLMHASERGETVRLVAFHRGETLIKVAPPQHN